MLTEVCGEFDVWTSQSGLRCGLKEHSENKGHHLFQIDLKKGHFGFGISRRIGNDQDSAYTTACGKYHLIPRVDSEQVMSYIKDNLTSKTPLARSLGFLPKERKGFLPSDYGIALSRAEKLIAALKDNLGDSFSTLELKVLMEDAGIAESSCIPNDFTYNHWNDGEITTKNSEVKKRKLLKQALFERNGESYCYLGPESDYTGHISNAAEAKVGKWENGMIVEWYVNKDPQMASSVDNKVMKHSSEYPLNSIYYGPPGTGKTYHTIEGAVRAAEPDFVVTNDRDALKTQYDALVSAKRIRFVTFHQSFGYEEFVQGLRAETDDNGQIRYQVKDGIFKQICDDASGDRNNNYVLIIDEINRGNISKIFGELITLIEPSKRTGETNKEALSVRLPYSKDTAPDFSVPDNLYIIGTMNTADRSLAMMDTALRRRFDFKEMMPNPARLQDTVVHGINLRDLLTIMNQRIEVLYNREHTLGHAFFIPVKEMMEQRGEKAAFVELQSAFKNKIIPLLEEYFFEDWHKIRLILGDNQKKEDCQFVQEHRLNNLNDLFGPGYEADSFGQQQSRYEINSSAFTSIQAYLGILGGNVSANPADSTLQRVNPETEAA
ncbi:hypothetical protein C9I89_13800 [Photobacterium lipolyticum]|uniref:Uncharacterized protein n=2 Tax=Photobacterium lipolyticum TaxID=266810 RepID=A0A2T3MWW7_9GAMM|nr:hypothetical protein C9I89_13800 [Photobacterium lipolyticum]